MFRYVVSGLMGIALAPAAHAAANCSGDLTPPPLPLPSTVLEPVAAELYSRTVQLGVPSGVLTQGNDVSQSVDRVLLRLRADGCRELAKAAPAAVGANPDDPAAYKPKTAFDNTPWRFNMTQNGKRMTADEFDAWMKSRGVRVVGRKDTTAPASEPAPAQATTPGK